MDNNPHTNQKTFRSELGILMMGVEVNVPGEFSAILFFFDNTEQPNSVQVLAQFRHFHAIPHIHSKTHPTNDSGELVSATIQAWAGDAGNFTLISHQKTTDGFLRMLRATWDESIGSFAEWVEDVCKKFGDVLHSDEIKRLQVLAAPEPAAYPH